MRVPDVRIGKQKSVLQVGIDIIVSLNFDPLPGFFL